jgi:hypothetical protein
MRSSEAALGSGVGAQRPVLRGNELKKTGARSARARTRGQNPLVVYRVPVPAFLSSRMIWVSPSPFPQASTVLPYWCTRNPWDQNRNNFVCFQVIDSSDVVIQVLDARDPLGTRSQTIENYIKYVTPTIFNFWNNRWAKRLFLKFVSITASYR